MDPIYRGATAFFSFSLPICRATADYRGVFKNFLDDAETQQLIDTVVHARSAMGATLLDRSLSYEEKIIVVDKYLSALTTLYESLLAQGGVKVNHNFVFEWVLYINGSGDTFKSAEMIFELIMLLHTKALLHYYLARNLLETDVRAFLSDAGKHFLIASSIMENLQASLCPEKWGRKLHHSQPNPCEATPGHCACLSLYFRTCAQVCASIKALENASASALVRSRVAVAVVNYASRCTSSLVEVNAPNKPFISHVATIRELFAAVANWQLGQHSYEKQEVGGCMGCCQVVKSHLAEQASSKHEALKRGLPKTPASSPALKQARQALEAKVDELHGLADRDNRFVHFQVVSVVELPQEALVMAPQQPYALPTPEKIVVFKPNQRTSMFSSIFGGLGRAASTKTSGASEADAAEQPPADPSPPQQPLPVYPGLQASASIAPAPYPPVAPVANYAPSAPVSAPAAYQPYVYNQTAYPTLASPQSTPVYPPQPTAPPSNSQIVAQDEALARQLQAQLDMEGKRR